MEFLPGSPTRAVAEACEARRPTRRSLTWLVAAMLVGWLPTAGDAQTVRGRVVIEVEGAPVEGMFMSLVDEDTGERKAGALTDASGLFVIEAPPGRYRLRGDRIGLRTVVSGPYHLAADSRPFLELSTEPEAIALEGIDVEGEERCRVDPAVGTATARVWEEVRKALDAVAWSSETGLYRYSFNRFERRLDAKGRRVESESERTFTGWSRNPYVSVSPEQLEATGFAAGREGSRVFFAPDAHVLLSQEFLRGHCFRLERDEGGSGARVGLAFEPVERRPGVDVEGVLWLDEDTGLLDRVDFNYLNFDADVRSRLVGGTVEFRRLDSGAWIVSSWVIRLPVLGRREGRGAVGSEHVLIGIREEGGEVARVVGGGSEPPPAGARDRARIVGVVFDSTGAGPLTGARVYASGTSHSATSGPDGAFEIPGLRPGEYALGVTHPRLDSMGIRMPMERVAVSAGTTTRVELTVPRLESALAADLCPSTQRSDSTSVLVGTVRDGSMGSPVAAVTVRLTDPAWTVETPSTGGVLRRDSRWLETSTTSDGRFAFCQIPADQYLLLDLSHGGRSMAPDTVRVDRPGSVTVHDLRLPPGAL